MVVLECGKCIDFMLVVYLCFIFGVLLNIVFVLVILDIFGVKIIFFVVLLVGVGFVIGMVWGGLLMYFVVGVFM